MFYCWDFVWAVSFCIVCMFFLLHGCCLGGIEFYCMGGVWTASFCLLYCCLRVIYIFSGWCLDGIFFLSVCMLYVRYRFVLLSIQ